MTPRSTNPYPPGSRTGRVVIVLHAAGTEGLTIGLLAERCDIKPYDAKQVLHRLLARKRAILIAARRNTENKLEEVWACACPLNHSATTARGPKWSTEPLTDAARQRGHQGVAAARAALEKATRTT